MKIHAPGSARAADALETAGASPARSFALATSGSPAPLPYQTKMEKAFGTSFAGVSAYLGGAEAGRGLGALGALAASHGEKIAFRPSSPDEGLVAHELAHVVQQRAGGGVHGKALDSSEPEDAAEQRADAAAAAVVRREMVPDVGTVGGDSLHRMNDATSSSDAPGGDGRWSVIERLVRAAGGSAMRLRQLLAESPADAMIVEQFFQSGHDHPGLNALLAAAFPPAAEGANMPDAEAGEGDKEKDPEDATLPLPAERKGDKALSKGQMKWSLKAISHSAAHVEINFKPDATKVEAKNVSFVQTVLSQLGTKLSYAGTTDTDPVGQKAQYEPYEEATTKQRVDHIARLENDPFYGAMWSVADKKWVQEGASTPVGSSTKGGTSVAAAMTDAPTKRPIRIGHGDFKIEFETVPMVLETREPLGALKWGWSAKDEKNAPIVLTGGMDADCTDTPSASHAQVLDKFYEAKFETIVDEFAVGKWDLTAAHKVKLDTVVSKMKGNAALQAQLGGAADLTGSDAANAKVSLKRAEAVRDYLVGKGIDRGRITLESYGADWARVTTTPGKDEPKNRRVQIWLT